MQPTQHEEGPELLRPGPMATPRTHEAARCQPAPPEPG